MQACCLGTSAVWEPDRRRGQQAHSSSSRGVRGSAERDAPSAKAQEEVKEEEGGRMLLLLHILSPWRREVVHKLVAQDQSPVSAPNTLATTRCGLGRDGASLAEPE